jgi:hypothetical protein
MAGLMQSLEQATSLSHGTAPDVLEAYFSVCTEPDTFSDFIYGLSDTAFWRAKLPGGGDLPELCRQFAKAVDKAISQQVEPAYHSRRHCKEVCLALSMLLRAGSVLPIAAPNSWVLTDEDCWILLLAAISHDFGHEGRPNQSPGELEEKACSLVALFRETHPQLSQRTVDIVQTLIRATEPTLYPALIGLLDDPEEIQRIDAMKILLVEADLFASMLPTYGITLGNLLAQEFEPHAPALAKLVASPAGRKGFLESHPYFSPNSRQLCFNDVIRTAIIQTQD